MYIQNALPALSPRRRPHKLKVDMVLEAAARILQQGGPLTTNQVAVEANGAFWRRFANVPYSSRQNKPYLFHRHEHTGRIAGE